MPSVPMTGGSPLHADGSLATVIGRVFVAYTIEFDNAWEARVLANSALRVFLVSRSLWANFLRFVAPTGTRMREVVEHARLTNAIAHMSLAGLQRWGYVTVDRTARDRKACHPDWVVRPTLAGMRCREGLAAPEGCWRARPPYAIQTRRMIERGADALPRFPAVTHRGGWPDGS